MGNIIITSLIFISLGQFVFAQSLIPATSDDLAEFDQQISKDANKISTTAKDQKSSDAKNKKAKSPNFGALVSKQAKDLRTADADQKNKMGKWVSEQRENEHQRAATEKGEGSGSDSSGKDARTSSPVNNDHGNSSDLPGQPENHRK